ncbi:flavin reductase family protein [Specibacter sp. RAF43]|uniref:flavin reductase family protein n=1 Tax=Specibacter sp. RAF43 TaxID=3233057 RepID=UPI003F9E0175
MITLPVSPLETAPARTVTGDFKAAFGHHPAGVAIITADVGTGPVGITASSVASVSAEPPILAFSLASQSGSAAAIAVADSLVVHLLTVGDLDLARIFARAGTERFTAAMAWTRLATGEPLLAHHGHALRCRVLSRTAAGSSLLVAAAVLEVLGPEPAASNDRTPGTDPGTDPAGAPLVYHNRVFHRLGEHSVLGNAGGVIRSGTTAGNGAHVD